MSSTYNPHQIEQHWYPIWESQGYFQPSGNGTPYCIMLPPPNVTGTLHMGHGFQQTLMDALIRFHRMDGDNTLWQAGTDHAGIATQMVVERQLQQQGLSRHDIGRNAFIEKVWQWKNQSDGTIKQQMRRLGTSPDWQRERFTMDESISRAVIEVFVHLYQEGLIYRGQRLVNWDPVLHTAISDLEVISEEQQGQLWQIRYPLVGEEGYLVVATTRPETLFGDVAVAVHPDDERYRHLVGKQLQLPLTDRTIPIIADTMVDQTFGTGCVKITPAHDFNDYATGQRHQLPLINIFTPDAHLNDNVPTKYRSLERFHAREQVIADLTALNLLDKITPHLLKVPKGDRSGAVIEPYLTYQWFMAMKGLAAPAIAAVKNGEVRFIPDNWSKIYFQWLENIEDWCISRQLWWGHRIPAWYDSTGKVYVGHSETEVRKKYHLGLELTLEQDNDVLDTWFSSALWPFATLDWPQETPELTTFYPTQALVTGFDIIFFWVARMIMLGLHFRGKVPFKEVYITGLIRDSEGQKMSKSKGNILDPIDLIDGISLDDLLQKRLTGLMQPQMQKRIEQITRKEFPDGIPAYGTDALRFTFCALASPGREIRFDLGRLAGYRNFCNKIWNAARYVQMNVTTAVPQQSVNLSLPDRWIRSKLQLVISQARQHFQNYRFDFLAQEIYEFVWNEYCDWYLEFSKSMSTEPGTQQTLMMVLEALLRLIHPIMPFISEEIWQQIAPLAHRQGKSIMLEPYPTANQAEQDPVAEQEIEWLKKIILAIRNIRGEMTIAPKKQIPLLIGKAATADQAQIKKLMALLKNLAKLEDISFLSANENPPPSMTAIVDQLELHIPMADLIDIDAEKTRLEKEIAKNQKDLDLLSKRLENSNFIAKAPANVVEKEQARCAELRHLIGQLQSQLTKMGAIA